MNRAVCEAGIGYILRSGRAIIKYTKLPFSYILIDLYKTNRHTIGYGLADSNCAMNLTMNVTKGC